MTATARHEQAEKNRRYVRELLKHRQPSFAATLEAIELALDRDRQDPLPPGLRDHAFSRSGCQLADGEPLLAARARGCAAESALDAVTAIRGGDLADARGMLHAALTYLDTRDTRMKAAP